MDGLQASKEIKHYFKEKGVKPPVIIGLTGNPDEATVSKGLKHGMDKVYSKPMRKNQVLQLLKEAGYI